MSGEAFRSHNGGVEYELRCDACGASFDCHDDSFYSWDVLCSAAEAEGWRIHPDLDGEHECSACATKVTYLSDHRRRLAAPAARAA